MTTYESEIKTISSSEEMVFGILSDLKNLEKIAQNPSLKDKVKNLEFDTDSCSFSVEGFGTVGFRIIEREPFKTIKYPETCFNLFRYGSTDSGIRNLT